MKHLIVFSTLLLFSCSTVFCQSAEDRVKEIRAMYAEVNNLHSLKKGYSCKRGTRGKQSDIDFQGKNTYIRANECYYPNSYYKVSSVSEGWEWSSTAEYYYKNGNLFFAYVVHNDICDRSEYRFYYYPNGAVARILEKPSNCDNPSSSKNREVTNAYRKNELLRMSNSELRDAMNIIN